MAASANKTYEPNEIVECIVRYDSISTDDVIIDFHDLTDYEKVDTSGPPCGLLWSALYRKKRPSYSCHLMGFVKAKDSKNVKYNPSAPLDFEDIEELANGTDGEQTTGSPTPIARASTAEVANELFHSILVSDGAGGKILPEDATTGLIGSALQIEHSESVVSDGGTRRSTRHRTPLKRLIEDDECQSRMSPAKRRTATPAHGKAADCAAAAATPKRKRSESTRQGDGDVPSAAVSTPKRNRSKSARPGDGDVTSDAVAAPKGKESQSARPGDGDLPSDAAAKVRDENGSTRNRKVVASVLSIEGDMGPLSPIAEDEIDETGTNDIPGAHGNTDEHVAALERHFYGLKKYMTKAADNFVAHAQSMENTARTILNSQRAMSADVVKFEEQLQQQNYFVTGAHSMLKEAFEQSTPNSRRANVNVDSTPVNHRKYSAYSSPGGVAGTSSAQSAAGFETPSTRNLPLVPPAQPARTADDEDVEVEENVADVNGPNAKSADLFKTPLSTSQNWRKSPQSSASSKPRTSTAYVQRACARWANARPTIVPSNPAVCFMMGDIDKCMPTDEYREIMRKSAKPSVALVSLATRFYSQEELCKFSYKNHDEYKSLIEDPGFQPILQQMEAEYNHSGSETKFHVISSATGKAVQRMCRQARISTGCASGKRKSGASGRRKEKRKNKKRRRSSSSSSTSASDSENEDNRTDRRKSTYARSPSLSSDASDSSSGSSDRTESPPHSSKSRHRSKGRHGATRSTNVSGLPKRSHHKRKR